jgi:hypothetical protein
MKEFLNPEPVKISVQDKTGVNHEFTLKIITPDEMDEISKLSNEFKESPPGTVIKKQLSVMFGKDDTFYSNFSISVLKKVLDYVNQEMINPKEQK